MRKQSAQRKLASNLLSRGLSSLGKTLKTPVSQLTGKQKLLGALGAGGAILGGKALYSSFPGISVELQKALSEYQLNKALSEVANYSDYLGKPVAEDTAHFLNNAIRAGSKDPGSLNKLYSTFMQNADDVYRRGSALSNSIAEASESRIHRNHSLDSILRGINFPGELAGNHYKNSPGGIAYLAEASKAEQDKFLESIDYLNRLQDDLPLRSGRIDYRLGRLAKDLAEHNAGAVRLVAEGRDTIPQFTLQGEVARLLRKRGGGGFTLPSDSDIVTRASKMYRDLVGRNTEMVENYIPNSFNLSNRLSTLAEQGRALDLEALKLKQMQEYLGDLVGSTGLHR